MTNLIPHGALEVSEFEIGGCHHIGNSGINELSSRINEPVHEFVGKFYICRYMPENPKLCEYLRKSGYGGYWQPSCGPDGWYDSFEEAEAALLADNERRRSSGQ